MSDSARQVSGQAPAKEGLSQKRALVIIASFGIEEPELTRPVEDLRAAGVQVTVAGASYPDPADCVVHDQHEGIHYAPDCGLEDVDARDFDLLVIPGGTVNVDRLRVRPEAHKLAQDFAAAGKPIAAVCHGPWVLVNADVLQGKTMTSCRYIRVDLEHAGATWLDEECHVDDANGWRLITSRRPADLEAFDAAMIAALEG